MVVNQSRKNPKLSGQQTFLHKKSPDEARETVSRDKPKKRMFASHDIAKECVFNVLEL